MTLPERARALCDRLRVAEHGIHGKAILAALEATRREAIEEAARTAERLTNRRAMHAIHALIDGQ